MRQKSEFLVIACFYFLDFFICLWTYYQYHERFCDESRGEQEISWGGVGVALLCEQFLPIREWRCEDINALITGIIRIDETLLALCCI